jgi:hypothetical protein
MASLRACATAGRYPALGAAAKAISTALLRRIRTAGESRLISTRPVRRRAVCWHKRSARTTLACASYAVWRQMSANAEQEILDRARIMLETSRAMRTYTTTQIAALLDREQSRRAQVDNSVDQVLNVHIPEAMKKAIAELPTVQEQRALQGAEDRIVEGARQERQELPQREFLPQSIPFTPRQRRSITFPSNIPTTPTWRLRLY